MSFYSSFQFIPFYTLKNFAESKESLQQIWKKEINSRAVKSKNSVQDNGLKNAHDTPENYGFNHEWKNQKKCGECSDNISVDIFTNNGNFELVFLCAVSSIKKC